MQVLLQFLKAGFLDDEPSLQYLSIDTTGASHTTTLLSSTDGSLSLDSTVSHKDLTKSVVLEKIIVYPIKSCGAMVVDEWVVDKYGLQFDRQWTLIDSHGVALNQKKVPKLYSIKPHIDLKSRTLSVEAPGMPSSLTIPLDSASKGGSFGTLHAIHRVKVCGSVRSGRMYDPSISRWFSQVLGRECHLVMSNPTSDTKERAFKNEGQFLLVSEASVHAIRQKLAVEDEVEAVEAANTDDISYASRFRPNFVVSGCQAFEVVTRTSMRTTLFSESKNVVLTDLHLSVLPDMSAGGHLD